jgi:hypothetical protein
MRFAMVEQHKYGGCGTGDVVEVVGLVVEVLLMEGVNETDNYIRFFRFFGMWPGRKFWRLWPPHIKFQYFLNWFRLLPRVRNFYASPFPFQTGTTASVQ